MRAGKSLVTTSNIDEAASRAEMEAALSACTTGRASCSKDLDPGTSMEPKQMEGKASLHVGSSH